MLKMETCVIVVAVRSRYFGHLGLQLLKSWISVLPC